MTHLYMDAYTYYFQERIEGWSLDVQHFPHSINLAITINYIVIIYKNKKLLFLLTKFLHTL